MQTKKKGAGSDLRQYGLLLALAIIIVFFHVLTGGSMLTPLNISNILMQNSYVIILAIGMMFVIVAGNFDMSVGSAVGLVGGMAGVLCCKMGLPALLVMLVCLAVGALLGAWNGMWIAFFKIPAFVVTLGSMLIFRGLMLLVLGSSSIGPFPAFYSAISLKFITDPFETAVGINLLTILVGVAGVAVYWVTTMRRRARQRQYGIGPGPARAEAVQGIVISAIILAFSGVLALHKGIAYVLVLLGVLIGAYSYIGNRTTIGRRVYAVGGNEKAARLSGIKTNRMVFLTFVNMGVLAALAGIVYSARLNFATPTAGDGFELDAIAACFIGGSSPSGGVGTLRGAITGALIMGVLNNGMSLMGLGVDIQQAIKGMVLILAVLLDVVAKTKGRTVAAKG